MMSLGALQKAIPSRVVVGRHEVQCRIVMMDRPAPHSNWLATTIHMSAHRTAIRTRLLQAVSGSSLNAGECRILLKTLVPFWGLSPFNVENMGWGPVIASMTKALV
jgi:hypothetical protein